MTPSTDWKEVIAPDEAERFERHAAYLHEVQLRRDKAGPKGRILHLKQQAGAEGSFTVLPDLPEHARHGLGAKPGTYRALVRYSNGSITRQGDTAPDVRGIAVKVIGVQGKKLIPGMEDAVTQDFLAILGTSLPFAGPDEFLWFVKAIPSPALLVPRLVLEYGPIEALKVMRHLIADARRKTPSLATASFCSQLPIQWGPYAVRYRFAPVAAVAPDAKPVKTASHYSEELTARLRDAEVSYDFGVQFFVDAQKTPIEDGRVEWKEADAPWVTVGRLTLPKQDVAKVAAEIEHLSFDPWHALVEHKPLGAMMRARSAAYRVSTQERKAGAEPTA